MTPTLASQRQDFLSSAFGSGPESKTTRVVNTAPPRPGAWSHQGRVVQGKVTCSMPLAGPQNLYLLGPPRPRPGSQFSAAPTPRRPTSAHSRARPRGHSANRAELGRQLQVQVQDQVRPKKEPPGGRSGRGEWGSRGPPTPRATEGVLVAHAACAPTAVTRLQTSSATQVEQAAGRGDEDEVRDCRFGNNRAGTLKLLCLLLLLHLACLPRCSISESASFNNINNENKSALYVSYR